MDYELYNEDSVWLNFGAALQNIGFVLRLRECHVDDPAQIFDLIEIPQSDQGSFPVDKFMNVCREFEWKVHIDSYEALFYEQIIHFFHEEDFQMTLDKRQKTLTFIRL